MERLVFNKLGQWSLVKTEDYELLEKASKKQLIAQLGEDSKSKEIADWLSESVPRDDVQQWFINNYKKNPNIYNDENKENIKHYIGMSNIHKNIGEVRLNKDHSFEEGMKKWKDAEGNLQSELSGSMIEPSSKTKKLIDLGNGWGWYDLGVGYCPEEGKKMNHCGNINAKDAKPGSRHYNDRILSLRRETKVGGKIFHEPKLTFIENNGYLGETKGRANEKPSEKYHDAIVQLLKHPRIKENVGGGYSEFKNFSIGDLSEDRRKDILNQKPNIERVWSTKSGKLDPKDYPEKHNNDISQHNEAIKKYNKNQIDDPLMLKFKDADPALMGKLFHDTLHGKNKAYNRLNIDNNISDIERAFALVNSPHFKPEHVPLALRHPQSHVAEAAVKSKHFKPEHMDLALRHESLTVAEAAINSPHFKPEHMDLALNHREPYVAEAAVESKHFKPEHMDFALKHNDPFVARAAVKSKHFKPEHMDFALRHVNGDVARAAVNSKHFKPEHMDLALGHEDPFVARAAVESEHFKPEHMDLALNHKSPNIVEAAVRSKHFKPEHMDFALGHEDPFVARAAVESEHFKPEHISMALTHPSDKVKSEVRSKISQIKQ